MISKIRSNKSAFTLVEIMIVVAIIGLLAALAIPGFVKARKQSQGRRVINDARQWDSAIDQWAIEKGMKDGDSTIPANYTNIVSYLKAGSTATTLDVLNNAFTFANVGAGQVAISTDTKSSLDGVGIDWGAY